jgi:hypothetical protein
LQFGYEYLGPQTIPPTAGGFGYGFEASFYDTLTIGGYSGSGFIRYAVPMDGCCLPFLDELMISSAGEGRSPFDWVFTQPFTAGEPFTFGVAVQAGGLRDPGDGLPSGPHHLSWTVSPIQILDSHMNPITGYTLTSASGRVYDTPEPASILLMITVLLGVAGGLKRR